MNYVSVNTRGPYRYSVRALLLCNSQQEPNQPSQNYSCLDHTVTDPKNSCKNIQSILSTGRFVISDLEGYDACATDNFVEQTSMETRNMLLNESIDPSTSNACPYYNVVMPNINDTFTTSKKKYTREEPTGNYDEMDEPCFTEFLRHRSQGAHNILSNDSLLFSSIEQECKDSIDCVKRSNFSQVVDDKKFADKTTFCRPVLNTYNQKIIHKTVETNRKLQTRIRKLIEVQEREKQREAWNNYINKLKNKYRYRTFTRHSNLGIINRQKKIDVLKDYLNSRFKSNKSGFCKHLLQDIYAPQNDSQPCCNYPSSEHLEQYNSIPPFLRNDSRYIFENNPLNFLTSSQGRLLMLEQERLTDGFCNSDCYPVPQSRHNNSNKIFVPRQRGKREDRYKTECNLYKKCNTEQRRNYCTDEYEENEWESSLESQKEQYLREAEEHLRKGAELEKKRKALLKKRENKRLRKSNTEEPVEKKLKRKGQDYDQDTEKVDSTEEEQRVDNNETDSDDETLKARYNIISDKVTKLKQNMCEDCFIPPNSSRELERKLENLIDTVQSLILQFKMNNNCILNHCNKNYCGLTTCISRKLLGKFVTDETKQASERNTKVRNSFETSGTSNIDNNQPNSKRSYKDKDQTNISGISEIYTNQKVSSHKNSKRYSVNDKHNETSENPNSNTQTKDFNFFDKNQTVPSKRHSVNGQTNETSENPNSNIQTKDLNDYDNNQTVPSYINSRKYSVNDQTYKTSESSNINIQTKDFNVFDKNQTVPSKRHSVNDQTNKTSESPNSNIQTNDINNFDKNQTVPSPINPKRYSFNDKTNKTTKSPNSNIQTKDFNYFEGNKTVSHRNPKKYSVDVQTDKTSLITKSSDSNSQIENFYDEQMKDLNKSQIERQDSKTSLIEEITTSRLCCKTDRVDIIEDDSKKREREKKEEGKRQKENHERERREKGQKDSSEENDSTRMPPTFGGDPDVRMLTVGIKNGLSSRPFDIYLESPFRPEVEKLAKSDKAVCNMYTYSFQSKFDRILIEEIDKSNKARRDIENILDDKLSHPCKFQLTFDIPTKERSTEVTASLSKTKLSYHNKTENSNSIENEKRTLMSKRSSLQSVTIAVNTDPLSFLTLLRISTETIGRLLSAVNFDYYSYLSMIQFPQLSREMGSASNQISQYVCNICGAVFMKASQLNDHIQGHGLGSTRDCCVCRHLLNFGQQSAGRFSCPYCGHRFTRAYCCELHQQSCAKRLGTFHDIDESLSILR